ncbi:MAG: transporter substrate-binding domain-containing protein [Synergistaceae bacterium]|nr:transporter substrate-binding domain-containing protein [Synergistaceae bacterium]MBR0221755.1 transporter substrate-binding domain-containing protein [Synergistaceae bacterium]
MKKFCLALLLIILSLASIASADAPSHIGVLTYLGTTEQEFQQGLDDLRKAVAPLIPAGDNDFEEPDMLESFILSLVKTRRVVHFYDTLLSMQMALKSRKINEVALPEAVGLYLVNNDPGLEILFSLNMTPSTISFGFKQGNNSLQKEFNNAIVSMKKDGTLDRLADKYIVNFAADNEEVKFNNFKDAKTIKVAVTGDLPPIDYIAPDGRPTGYNTAILAEIGKRIKKNIRLISVDAGGRSAALASERADVVFWYRNTSGIKSKNKKVGNALGGVMKDSLSGVILSEPYYSWDTDLIIGK